MAMAAGAKFGGISMPNQTLYINNINDKLSKDLLRRELYVLCSQFGAVLDVVALKTGKMRGQAFVVFQHLTSASIALQKLNGFEFYGKALRTAYCKSKSDAVAKEDGTFVPKHKRKRPDGGDKSVPSYKQPPAKKAAGETEKAAEEKEKTAAPMEEDEAEKAPESVADDQPPNNILFLERLPGEVNAVMLKTLFKQFPGLKEVRMVPGKPGIAFVEFEAEAQAAVAKDTLQGFKLTPTNEMRITFAKKE
mmetsp:Transcript_20039/g.47770  ORF Transcript_20039/g.47770 Transcript_20039/m.47770 type:complete len:249 (+) Transcript_20039:301-1047(+)|eukprot:CAMPEP_0177721218 /NCGR_PEP_ID=MMETSP0484_2-20121128/17030_1 /TAXON_ID=354590 /ORGANISM="Rhodomonas lens, Strain RHODO" /LENGTH=248 /DNA_ID=CAMNT_0019233509 /DNA_START=304 /DNA_END=1050 /DNA_ORIENTATION=-